jgi:outer membrane protein assembly factor BamD (BamD/ComL family)
MKLFSSLLAVSLILAFSLSTGCSKKIEVDTVNLEYSFQTADDATQTTVNDALTAIDNANYDVAAEKLKAVAADPKLTPEQKTAVTDVVQQLEKR